MLKSSAESTANESQLETGVSSSPSSQTSIPQDPAQSPSFSYFEQINFPTGVRRQYITGDGLFDSLLSPMCFILQDFIQIEDISLMKGGFDIAFYLKEENSDLYSSVNITKSKEDGFSIQVLPCLKIPTEEGVELPEIFLDRGKLNSSDEFTSLGFLFPHYARADLDSINLSSHERFMITASLELDSEDPFQLQGFEIFIHDMHTKEEEPIFNVRFGIYTAGGELAPVPMTNKFVDERSLQKYYELMGILSYAVSNIAREFHASNTFRMDPIIIPRLRTPWECE